MFLVLSLFSCFKTLHDHFVRSLCLEVVYICTQLLSGVDCPIQRRTAVSCEETLFVTLKIQSCFGSARACSIIIHSCFVFCLTLISPL